MSKQATTAALDVFASAMQLESPENREETIWHLLYSLLELCDAEHIDFDATLSSVRSDMFS